MGRWGEAADMAQGPSDYMKFKDGTTTVFRVLTDPVVQNKTYDSDPDNPKTVFSWVVWDYETESPKVLSKGASFINKLDFISEQWGDEVPMRCDIAVKTTGTLLNTKYDFSAIPARHDLPADWQVRVAALDLNRLVPNHITVTAFSKGSNPALDDPAKEDVMDRFSRENNTPAAQPDKVIEDIGSEPINLDDIPFSEDPSKSQKGDAKAKK